MASMNYIQQNIRGFYPTSKKLTTVYFAELDQALQNHDDREFQAALDKYRAGPNANYIPSARELIALMGPGGYSSEKLSEFLFNSLILWGWTETIRRAMSYELGYGDLIDKAICDWLITCGMTENALDYHGCPDWWGIFLMTLHDRQIIEAYHYVAEYGPKSLRQSYRKELDFLELIGNETAQTYFSYFRLERCRKLSATERAKNPFYGRAKNLVKGLAEKMSVEPFNFEKEKKQQYKKLATDLKGNNVNTR